MLKPRTGLPVPGNTAWGNRILIAVGMCLLLGTLQLGACGFISASVSAVAAASELRNMVLDNDEAKVEVAERGSAPDEDEGEARKKLDIQRARIYHYPLLPPSLISLQEGMREE